MEPKSVSIGKGVSWIRDGWKIFRNDMGMWILFTIIYFAAYFLLKLIPVVGILIAQLLNPVLMGGLLFAASESARGEKITFNHILYAFMEPDARNKTLLIGALGIVFTIICVIIAFFFIGGGAVMGLLTGSMSKDAGAGAMVGAGMMGVGMLLAVLIFMLLFLIYMTAIYFAIPLVVFTDISVVDAIGKSFKASIKNILPLFIYSIVVMIISVIAVPITLGLGLLALFPVLNGAYYASYIDIFEENTTYYV